MHHTLRLYSRHRESALKFYMFWAKWTKIPLMGSLVRKVANAYGRNMEGAYLLTTEEAEEIVDMSEVLSVGPCACRQVFKNCDNPINVEIMLGVHGNVFVEERPQDYRTITKQEAKEILRDCHRRGLIHTIIKCKESYYSICNCCSCCCVPLRLNKKYGIGSALVRNKDIIDIFRSYQESPHENIETAGKH